MIFKLMVNFKRGDTWETIFFFITDAGGSKEKNPTCAIVKTAFFSK